MSQYGENITSKNILNTKQSASVVPSTATKSAGRSFDASGNLYTVDATASLPAGAKLFQGIAYTPDGRMCTTTGAPTPTSKKINGMAVRNDGAVHIVTSATSPTRISGRSLNVNGSLVVVTN